METTNPSLKTEGQIFRIDTTRADEIEQIAKDVTTMFTSWEDFIKECLHVYIKSWTDPVKAQDLMQKAWLPHFKPVQLEYMKEMMPPEEYQKFTAGMEMQRKELRQLPFNPSPVGPKFFKVDSEVFGSINEIISQPKASKKFGTVNEFFDEGIDLFIIWWTNPEKSYEKMFEMWPYLPDHVKEHWQNHKDLKATFEQFNTERRKWCKENDIDPDLIPEKVHAELESQHQSKTKKREREYEIPERRDFQDSIVPSDMQTISNYAQQSWNSLCTEREDKEDEIRRLDLPSATPADALPYDNYPLIWDFYTRFLPVKIVLTKLGNMIVDEPDKMVDYELFRDEAYDAALGLSEMLRMTEEKYGTKRNKKLSTGLPSPPFGINVKDKMKLMKKFDASKERFKNHFIGMKTKVWTKRKNDDDKNNWFDGALNAMGLAYFVSKQVGTEAKSKGGKAKYEIKVGLTKLGKEFCELDNYVISQHQDREPPSKWKHAFYEEEVEFIIKKIIPIFPLENDLVKLVLDRLEKISDKDNEDETYLTAPEIDKFYWPPILDWVNQNENEKVGHYKNIKTEVKKNPNDVDVSAWRAATMGRLSELNLVEWRIGTKDEGREYQGISKFCLKKPKK